MVPIGSVTSTIKICPWLPSLIREWQSNYFDQRFRIEPKFIVSDALSLNLRINAINGSRWGDANGGYGGQAT